MISPEDLKFLQIAVGLAEEALEAGDAPFGSVLVSDKGEVLFIDRNRTLTGENGNGIPDATLHPEFTISRWAQLHLSPEERLRTIVYTSGEHCAMCSAAHAYAGLGQIKYASSTVQYVSWMKDSGIKLGAVAPLSITEVAPGIPVEGPVPDLANKVRELHVRRWTQRQTA